MTTAADISLRVMREVDDVIEGTATNGSTTTLVDSTLGTLPNDHFNGGRLWILSGTHAGKVFTITDFATSTGTVTFTAVTGAIAAGVRYAIARSAYPWDQVLTAINQALETTWTTGIDTTLTGDGETLTFTLPNGVFDIKRIEFEDPSTANSGYPVSSHYKEQPDGTLRFDYGYPPRDGYTIRVYYRKPHDTVTDYTTTISNEINAEWLKWEAVRQLLWWGITKHGQQVEYAIEPRMNKALMMLSQRTPRREPDIIIRTGG